MLIVRAPLLHAMFARICDVDLPAPIAEGRDSLYKRKKKRLRNLKQNIKIEEKTLNARSEVRLDRMPY